MTLMKKKLNQLCIFTKPRIIGTGWLQSSRNAATAVSERKNMHASKRLRQRQTRRNAPQRHRHCDNRSTNIPQKTGNNMIQKSQKSKNSCGSDRKETQKAAWTKTRANCATSWRTSRHFQDRPLQLRGAMKCCLDGAPDSRFAQ